MRRIVLSLLPLCAVLAAGMLLVSPHRTGRLDLRAGEPPERRPAETAWIQRTFPYYRADARAYGEAIDEARTLHAAHKSARFGAWTFAGPLNVGGRIVDLAFNPKRPSVTYAAAATGGVFKSTDGGKTWSPIFDDLAVLSIGDLAVDPVHPETLYVGTGEGNGGHNNFAGGGVYKSIDGGTSWRYAGLAETTSIGRVLVDPSDTRRVFVAAVGSYFAPNPERGVYRSTDGGEAWERVLFIDDSTGVVDLVMRPDDPSTLLAASWQRVRRYDRANLYGDGSGLYRSRDGGTTWEALGAAHGLPDPDAWRDAQGRARFGRIGLAVCRDVPDVMYALYTDGSTYLGLYRTDDGGDHWYNADPERRLRSGFGGFSWYFGQVRVHPENPDVVFVLDVQIMRSEDGGNTWASQSGTHVDHHALAFHPDDPDVVFNGNDGGLAVSANNGRTWGPLADLPITQFYEVAIDPSDPRRLFGGTQDNGTVYAPAGDTDDWRALFGGDGFYVIVHPDDPQTIYVEYQNGNLFKTTDGGFSFRIASNGVAAGEKRNWSMPVVMDPERPEVLYLGTTRLYRTTNGAVSWVPISPPLVKGLATPMLGSITTIAVAPSAPDVLYVGTDDGNVWVTPDGGTTWNDVTAGLPFRWVTRVAVDPLDARTAYVTFSGLKWKDPQPHVFRTRDMGATWQDITSNLPDAPVNAFAIDPFFPEVLFLGSDVGAFVSTDGGERWEPLGTGLPAVSVYDLKLYPARAASPGSLPTGRFLLAGTHGRSMYRLSLDSLPTALEPAPTETATPVLDAPFPNPFIDQTTLAFRASAAGHARLEVFDVLGRRLRVLYDGSVDARPQHVRWDGRDAAGRALGGGTYLVRLTVDTPTGRTVRTTSLTHVR